MDPQQPQPQVAKIMVGDVLPVSAKTYESKTWPSPIWASHDPSIATVAASFGNDANITAVAPGTTVITATIVSTVQQFIVDVVAATPGAVDIVQSQNTTVPFALP